MENWEIKNVSKHFDAGRIRALNHASLSIAPGIIGLLGPNGAGKTTLMRILATVLEADEGTVTLGDLDWSDPLAVARNLGYLPQNFNLYKYLTVRETLSDIALFKDIPRDKRKTHVELAMERAHVTEFADRRIGKLSGGMLRRVGIAQAFVGEPRILIVDEPSSGLDPMERIHLRKQLRDYADGSRVVMISSHIVEDVESLCDQTAIMTHGWIRVKGLTRDVRELARGHVTEAIMTRGEYREMEKNHRVIGFWPDEDSGGVRVRYLINRDETTDNPVEPRLEDSYTMVMGGMIKWEIDCFRRSDMTCEAWAAISGFRY